jgi:hypothetical protein
MTEEDMLLVAQKYLGALGLLKPRYPSREHLLVHCIFVYIERFEAGLEQ